MISNTLLKDIKSLQLKKNRQQRQQFLVEGAKSVLELIESDFIIEHILCTDEFFEKYSHINNTLINNKIDLITEKQIEKLGSFKSNSLALAVAHTKPNVPLIIENNELALVLDDVRDPGNLGTIIRIADWYGINKIIASKTTTDQYNPKVISSTMGSFTRVDMFYTHLPDFLEKYNGNIYGAFMEGENIHNTKTIEKGLVVMGNESNGISIEIERLVNKKLTIPKFGRAESLNVAVATAVILDNFRSS
ncbi:MAG: RNA methyltransferase [Cyclobacteriaceae bacterium]|nr:RNA methyltransferase [Cyclobacteriaceae bacterium]